MLKKQRNKYLEDLGLSKNEYGVPNGVKTGIKERKFIKNYGFHPAECWSLDSYLCEWLYSHLMKYKEDASSIVDLEYHKVNFKGKEYTQLEAINYMINILDKHLMFDKDVYGDYAITDIKHIMELERKDIEDTQDAIRMLAEVFPAMWW